MRAGKLSRGAFNNRMLEKALEIVTYDNLMNNPEKEIIKMIMKSTKQSLEVSMELFLKAKDFKFKSIEE